MALNQTLSPNAIAKEALRLLKNNLVMGSNVYRAYEDSLLLDWVSMRDRKVCQTCRLYESRGPYKPSEYPPVPHVGCRCYPVISVVDGEPFDTAGLFALDYLTE